MADTFDAVVIGAGANGLAAATVLGRAGRRVLVVDAAEQVGGQSRVTEFAPGFRAAPLGLDAGWLPPAVARGLGLKIGDLADTEPAVSVTVPTCDGRFLPLWCDPARAAEEIRRLSPRDAERWRGFTVRLRKMAGFLEALYQLPPPDLDLPLTVGELAPLVGLGRRLRSLGRADMTELLRVLPMPVQDLLDEWFETEPLKAAIAAGGIDGLRQGPRSGGTAFVLLHYMVGAPPGAVRGRPWWRDNPDGFSLTVEALARRSGVAMRLGTAVERILVRDDAVAGVVLEGGDEMATRTVISTADPVRTLLGLVDPVWLDPEFLHAVRQIKLRGCTAYVQYALDALPETPGLAEPVAALGSAVALTTSLQALERAYDAAKYGRVSEQPHIEVSVPSLRWPSLAPDGKHVLMARVQYAPYRLADGEWTAGRADALAEHVTAAIGALMPRFADRVLYREVITPRALERRTGATEGAASHGELMLDQILFMRPVAGWGRYAMPVDGLYLGGAGAHPGPGVLGGPGWLAARQALAGTRRKAAGVTR